MTHNAPPYLLINPPLTDPTAPYHSLSYLVGAASASGYSNASCLDANIEGLNYLARSEHVDLLLRDCATLRTQLEAKRQLTRGEQIQYRTALMAIGLHKESVQEAIAVMKDQELFYDYPTYRQAVMVLTRWINVLSIKGYPGQFNGFALGMNAVVNLASVEQLTNKAQLETMMRPFDSYFRGPFLDALLSAEWGLIGLSVNYVSQLPFAVYMCNMIKEVRPASILCVGGTEISDDIKYLRDPRQIWRLFAACDAIVAGEGETAFVELLESAYRRDPLPRGRPGILLREASERLKLPTAIFGLTSTKYEDVASLPAPRYDVWNWSQYWSPEPVVLYSPTRGCYWNKCTFCDYGLNTDSPTSPSRAKPVPDAIRELAGINEFARTIYFSVDTMSPSYLRKLTKAIVENGLLVHWSAELRLEKTFRKDLADELKNAGCVSIAFGYESGSQRVLNLIDKGVNLEQVPEVLSELKRAGIAAQMMGFIGFPTETPEEAQGTYQFLLDHRDFWTLAGIGDFVLTLGSIVAKKHREFGIERISGYEGDDIVRALYWIDAEGALHISGDQRSEDIRTISPKIRTLVDDRPFVGGIDTNHSILYFSRFGPSLVPVKLRESLPKKTLVKTTTYMTPLSGVDGFCGRRDLGQFHARQRAEGRSASSAEVLEWLSQYPASSETTAQDPEEQGGEILEIFPSGIWLTTSPEMRNIRDEEGSPYRTIKDLLLRLSGVA